jgi:hypothetical protein
MYLDGCLLREHIRANSGCLTQRCQYLVEWASTLGQFESKSSGKVIEQCMAIQVGADKPAKFDL